MNELPPHRATTPLVAVRAWRFIRPGYLCDLGYQQIVEPREVSEAYCQGVYVRDDSLDERHEAPDEKCGCGFYAAKNLDWLRGNYGNEHIYGEVYLWGKVIEHAHGYRAQFSYPKQLWIPQWSEKRVGPYGPYLSYKYGVPCTTRDFEKIEHVHQGGGTLGPPQPAKRQLRLEDFVFGALDEDLDLSTRRMAATKAIAMLKKQIEQHQQAIESYNQALATRKKKLANHEEFLKAMYALREEWKK